MREYFLTSCICCALIYGEANAITFSVESTSQDTEEATFIVTVKGGKYSYTKTLTVLSNQPKSLKLDKKIKQAIRTINDEHSGKGELRIYSSLRTTHGQEQQQCGAVEITPQTNSVTLDEKTVTLASATSPHPSNYECNIE